MERTPAAIEATKTPPSCLSSFSLNTLPLKSGDLGLGVEFALACKNCSTSTFRIFGFPIVAPTPSPYYGVEAGETFFRPPHKMECVSCGAEGALFDVRVQGYDGVLNGGGSYESGINDEQAVPGQFSVVVTVSYNIELDELRELAEEASVNPSDLFDWITITGVSTRVGTIEFSYECA